MFQKHLLAGWGDMKDEIECFREVHLLEEFNVDLAIAGLAEDGSRFILRNGFFRPAHGFRQSGSYVEGEQPAGVDFMR